PRRAHRAAVDAGGLHAAEEPPVEARVPRQHGAVAGLLIQFAGVFHGPSMGLAAARVSRFSDIAVTSIRPPRNPRAASPNYPKICPRILMPPRDPPAAPPPAAPSWSAASRAGP